jgi:hypothetical protein
MTQQQIQNCLAAAKQERVHIGQLEQELVMATDKHLRSVLQYRIKISKDFLRKHLGSAKSLQQLTS